MVRATDILFGWRTLRGHVWPAHLDLIETFIIYSVYTLHQGRKPILHMEKYTNDKENTKERKQTNFCSNAIGLPVRACVDRDSDKDKPDPLRCFSNSVPACPGMALKHNSPDNRDMGEGNSLHLITLALSYYTDNIEALHSQWRHDR